MAHETPIIDARILRQIGAVAEVRPFRPLINTPLEIEPLHFERARNAPVDALLILGMGPVDPIIAGKNREPVIGKPRARNNALAGLEIAAHNLVKPDGMIIPSGTATADPKEVTVAVALSQSTPLPSITFEEFKNDLGEEAKTLTQDQLNERWHQQLYIRAQSERAIRRSPTIEEVEKVYTTTEAELMDRLYSKAHAKIGKTGEKLGIKRFVDKLATETIENFINALNELDKQSRNAQNEMFNGSLAVITSRYHIARTMEIARYLGIEDMVVPLVSQTVLEHYGYKKTLDTAGEKFDNDTRWNEQKWIRTTRQIPEYFLPELTKITDDERFLITLQHVVGFYSKYGTQIPEMPEITHENIPLLRKQLSQIKRINPSEEDWLKQDYEAVNGAVDAHVDYTKTWLHSFSP